MKRLPIKHGIELAPMVDVVFLLLTTFLLSATAGRYSVLDLQLPSAAAGRRGEEATIEVRVRSDGAVRINGRLVSEADLRPAVERIRAGGRAADARVRLAADGRAPYRSVLAVLDALRSANLTNIELSAEVR